MDLSSCVHVVLNNNLFPYENSRLMLEIQEHRNGTYISFCIFIIIIFFSRPRIIIFSFTSLSSVMLQINYKDENRSA